MSDRDAQAFVALTDRLVAAAGGALSPLAAGILAALDLGLAADSRTFARLFGIEHALVLREVTTLAEEPALVGIARRDARTQRVWLVAGERLQRLRAG